MKASILAAVFSLLMLYGFTNSGAASMATSEGQDQGPAPVDSLFINNTTIYALGTVTVHFTNGDQVTLNVPGPGWYFVDASGRQQASISVYGSTYNVTSFPVPITYPDGSTGILYGLRSDAIKSANTFKNTVVK